MSRYVALLRGINVGGRHRVPMDVLRQTFEAGGAEEVETYIASGNVVFSTDLEPSVEEWTDTLERALGFPVPIVFRSAGEMMAVEDGLLLSGIDLATLHVGFLTRAPSAVQTGEIDDAPFAPERSVIVGAHAYLVLPDGVAGTKLPSYLERTLGVTMTMRNWKTVTALTAIVRRGTQETTSG